MTKTMAEKKQKISKERRDVLKKKIEELEDIIRYYDAMIEEIYETQEAMFPIFVDLVKLISRLYKEVKIEDDEMKNRINRLEETFTEKNENILKKYLKDNDDFTVAYT